MAVAMYSFESKEALIQWISEKIINANEACEILNCSRQSIDDLVKRGKLIPIKVFLRDRIFLKEDILNRLK